LHAAFVSLLEYLYFTKNAFL